MTHKMKKTHIKLLLIIPIIIIIFLFSSKVQKDNWAKEAPEIKHAKERENEVWGKQLNGHSPELFYGTSFYDLAKEMTRSHLLRSDKKIEELIAEIPKESINFQDSKFQMTIGQFALIVSNLKAVRLLLDKELNPNLIAEKAHGRALIIDINSGYVSRLPEGLLTLKYMIKKGANVNLYSKYAQSKTPLIEAACSGNFENVKTLIEDGANPHFMDKFSGYGPFRSPLSSSLFFKQINIVNYLIFNLKVDFRILKNPEYSKFHPGEY